MGRKVLLLDNDGTIVDTEGLTVPHLLEKIREVSGNKINMTVEDFFRRYHGQAGTALIEQISDDFGHPLDHDAVYGNRIAEVAELFRTQCVRSAPGIGEALHLLHTQGWEFAVVSNEPVERGLAALRNTENGDGATVLKLAKGRYYAAGKVRKPQPDVYLAAMQDLGVTPNDCIAVEDSKTGVQAAVAAGIRCFGYTGLAHPSLAATIGQELTMHGVNSLFSHWAELPALLD